MNSNSLLVYIKERFHNGTAILDLTTAADLLSSVQVAEPKQINLKIKETENRMEILIFGLPQGPLCKDCYESLFWSPQGWDFHMEEGKLICIDVRREIKCIGCDGKIVEFVDGELKVTNTDPLFEVIRV